MRLPLLPILVVLLFNGIVDFNLYRIIKQTYHRQLLAKIQAISAIVLAMLLVVVICIPKRNGSDDSLTCVMWMLFGYFTIYVPKYIFLIFHMLSRLPRVWRQKPWHGLSVAGVVLAIISFLLMWWGALINRLNIQVNHVDVPVVNLPKAFDGFTIAQISDLHVGTFDKDTSFVSKLVDRINALHPDMIVFTGDMVNRRSEEFNPFIKVVSRLHAPYGVYSIMGNHDYGDYSDWPSPSAKDQDVLDLKRMEGEANMKMLNNATDWIHIGQDSIALIGVENIGDPPFKTYGDLDKAYPNLNDKNVKILLSHNPVHWSKAIANRDYNVALTLSGHTHAMQMELFGISPAALRYKCWGGMYTDHVNQHLYVNIGAGTVAMPYRIGATPEITLLKLVAHP